MRTWLTLLGVVFAAACETEHPAAVAVRNYNLAVAQAYRQSDASLTAPWATTGETTKIFVLIDLKKASRQVLESEVLEQRTLSVTSDSSGVTTVETEELWRYYDRPLDPGRPAGSVFKVRMHMRWELVQEDGKYKVARGRTVAAEYLEPKNFVPDFGRHTTSANEHAGHR